MCANFKEPRLGNAFPGGKCSIRTLSSRSSFLRSNSCNRLNLGMKRCLAHLISVSSFASHSFTATSRTDTVYSWRLDKSCVVLEHIDREGQGAVSTCGGNMVAKRCVMQGCLHAPCCA